MKVLGHRGASSDHQENTLEAFAACAEVGADGFELDVRRSADDVLVVIHDAVLADGRVVRELMAADLPESIPLLADALEQNAEQFINIEIKNHPSDPDYDAEFGISIAVAGLVAAFSAAHRVLISSFDMDTILRIRQADPAMPLGWLTFGQADPRQIIARAEAHELAAVHPHDLLVDQAFVDRAHAAGLGVYTWTVDDPDRIRQLDSFGVDGVITNDPAGALAVLGR